MKAVAPNDSPSYQQQAANYPSFYGLALQDLQATQQLILKQIDSCEPLVEQLGHYAFGSQGKRIRPLAVLLTAKQCGYQDTQHLDLAAAIECLHTATLLHDDVVDESRLRRGQLTTHSLWGNAASILLGDYLHTKAFQLLVGMAQPKILDILSEATSAIVEGEIMQLACIGDTSLSEQNYREIIGRKTATLFQACTHSAAVLAGTSEDEALALRDFGWHFGIAYQMMNDLLDYSSAPHQTGKETGDDLAEGTMTLPLIRAFAQGSNQQQDSIKRALKCQAKTYLGEVLSIIQETEALAYTVQAIASEYSEIQDCLVRLPESPYKEALREMAAKFCTSDLYT